MVYLPQVFQFTPLREGRPAGIFDATRRPYFNSRPSARGDDGLHTLFERLPDFNSRPSARGDIAALVAFRHVEDFNSRPSARGDGLQCGIILSGQTFQFTPLREGRRAQYWFPVPEVFQFTPLREGRHVPVGLRLTARIFQFTPLREGRPSRTGANPGAEAISIHAPPRGAT